ncbi:MAG: FAD-dependent oxidoreductase [Phycisphaerae bacterium]|nr:FAD-dependent oxidoreductase [Phycisphaerae bacterium]
MKAHSQVIVIGAGLAGLSCARALAEASVECIVLESSDRVGGRLGSDRHQGFVLDRGFAVFLDAYPEARRQLDLEALELKTFDCGARIQWGERHAVLLDPWRHPFAAWRQVLNPVARWSDYPRLLELRGRMLAGDDDAGDAESDGCSAGELLARAKLSPQLIDGFFRPFFGGVFFDRELETSARMLRFVFRMFARGRAALPAGGMQAIADQIHAELPADAVRLHHRVVSIEEGAVVMDSGQRCPAEMVVIATDHEQAVKLVGDVLPPRRWRGTSTLYFAAEKPPLTEALLVLDGSGTGPVNHLAVPSNVCPTYAPAGAALVCANVVGSEHEGDGLEAAVHRQLREWFGAAVDGWKHLRTYHIPRALPDQSPAALSARPQASRLGPGRFLCGDHLNTASINGALQSGRLAAEAVLHERSAEVIC